MLDSRCSYRDLLQQFAQATLPVASQRQGFWRARFVGPWWLRWGGMPSCYVAGLWGWLGKQFLTPEAATNILQRRQGRVQALAMQAAVQPSVLDGQPVVALTYGTAGPMPWCWVTDELRALDERTLLGMTRVDLPVLRHCVFPFVLEREAA